MGRQLVGLLLELVEFRDKELRRGTCRARFSISSSEMVVQRPVSYISMMRLKILATPGWFLSTARSPSSFSRELSQWTMPALPDLSVMVMPDGPVQDLARIEGVIDLFVLEEPVGVDAGAGVVEVLAHKGITGRNVIVQFPLEVLANLGDHRGVDAVGSCP